MHLRVSEQVITYAELTARSCHPRSPHLTLGDLHLCFDVDGKRHGLRMDDNKPFVKRTCSTAAKPHCTCKQIVEANSAEQCRKQRMVDLHGIPGLPSLGNQSQLSLRSFFASTLWPLEAASTSAVDPN
jgi:hypothetical protein